MVCHLKPPGQNCSMSDHLIVPANFGTSNGHNVGINLIRYLACKDSVSLHLNFTLNTET